MKGEIRYIFRQSLFIQVKNYAENAGFIVCKPKLVKLSGSVAKKSNPMAPFDSSPGYMSPKYASPSHPSQRGGPGFTPTSRGGYGSQATPRRDSSLIGQTIRITQGPYKSYVGIVKDATDTLARVELHTSCQTISVDKSRIALLNQPKGKSSQSSYRFCGGNSKSLRHQNIEDREYGVQYFFTIFCRRLVEN